MEHHAVFAPQARAGKRLMDEIVAAAVELSRNSFGKHVIIKLLEQGTDERRTEVAEALIAADVVCQARHRNASYVVETALDFVPTATKAELMRRLMRPKDFLALASCQSGCHVIRCLMQPQHGHRQAALDILAADAHLLADSKYGQMLLQDVGLARPPCDT